MKNLNILFNLAVATTITLAALSVPAAAKAHNHQTPVVAGKQHFSTVNKQLNPPSASVPSADKIHAHHAEAPSKNKRHAYHRAAAPSPADAEYSNPPEPYPGLYKFARKCLEKVTETCGDEIFVNLFDNEPDVSEKCCGQLMRMGKACHDGVIKTTLSMMPGMMITEKNKITKRGAEIWSQCAFVTDNVKTSSFFPFSLI